MNFITFPVAATNIFPAANGTNGSQLVTEWNLRSREMVSTKSNIQYEVGHSYCHSKDDYSVRILQDDLGLQLNDYTLEVTPGRAIINGHYVETLVPMVVDLVEANAKLKQRAMAPLSGDLAIGIRSFYATDATIAGSLLVENEDNMYLGMQLVVLPGDEIYTPLNSPDDKSKVNCDLLLARFSFVNNKIRDIQNLDDKITYLDAERITNFSSIISGNYITKNGLNSRKIYAFAGKGTNPQTGQDTWEDVTDSMMVWDNQPVETSAQPSYTEAQFVSTEATAYLVVPHKQVEGMTAKDGVTPSYYAPKILPMPIADYANNTPGIVNSNYTAAIKDVAQKVRDFRTTLNGKQIEYWDEKNSDSVLPPINPAWECGDYILVGTDHTAEDTNDGVKPPATMYVVLPGKVLEIKFYAVPDSNVPDIVKDDGSTIAAVQNGIVYDSDEIPSGLLGAELVKLDWSQNNRDNLPNTEDPEYYPVFFEEDDNVRGIVDKDYFRVRYVFSSDDPSGHKFANYYYTVSKSDTREWSGPVYVTGDIPLATVDTIGGFLNVTEEDTDFGYVYRDDAGRLRLIDYSLLRSGTLAYQLGEDITLPSGVTAEEIQMYIDDYINDRVAFPSSAQSSNELNCINIYLSIYEDEGTESSTITIKNIDSRFNTALCLHILGNATARTTIEIQDCQKIKIANNIEGNPIINVRRSCLYYDSYVLDKIRTSREETIGDNFTGLDAITFWYAKFNETDPDLIVDSMTITEVNAPIIAKETDYWKEVGSAANDNHYWTALHSITFAGNGDIIGCGLLVANDSTDNVLPGEKIIVGDFKLPQGYGLSYPESCLRKPLKVTGTFVSAYYSDNRWYVTDTMFSAITGEYDKYIQQQTGNGTIAFHSKTTTVLNTLSQTRIPVWDTDTYHLFYGGHIG